jgi:hypothetical protein
MNAPLVGSGAPPLGSSASSERQELRDAHREFAAADARLKEAKTASNDAFQTRVKLQRELDRLKPKKFDPFDDEPPDDEPVDASEPDGFDELEDALAAIKAGDVSVLDREGPRQAKIASLEKQIADWGRAKELADQGVALRERDHNVAGRELDEAARAVVAAECGWPALKKRHDELCREVRAVRAALVNLQDAAPAMHSPHVTVVDVAAALGQHPLFGPERDTSFTDLLAALKGDPDAQQLARPPSPPRG